MLEYKEFQLLREISEWWRSLKDSQTDKKKLEAVSHDRVESEK